MRRCVGGPARRSKEQLEKQEQSEDGITYPTKEKVAKQTKRRETVAAVVVVEEEWPGARGWAGRREGVGRGRGSGVASGRSKAVVVVAERSGEVWP